MSLKSSCFHFFGFIMMTKRKKSNLRTVNLVDIIRERYRYEDEIFFRFAKIFIFIAKKLTSEFVRSSAQLVYYLNLDSQFYFVNTLDETVFHRCRVIFG